MKIVVKLEKLEIPSEAGNPYISAEGVHLEVEVDANYIKAYQKCVVGLMEQVPELKEILSLGLSKVKELAQLK